MTSKYKIGLAGVLLALIAIYFYNEDSLPPRTPRKIARLVSGLDISRGINLDKAVDLWTPNGDGEVLIRGILTDQEMKDLVKDAKTKDYKSLPIQENSGLIVVSDELLKGRRGFFKFETDKSDSRSFKLTILDTDKNELITYLSVQ